ncbi:YD repeat-containing protein [Nitrospirillum viridazoti Y2]|uniref:RHS repeat-associated protein n=1 Tax=Nitrospirillum amazonense TaxID=28077 RepID=A0A560HUY0_9PROT|nr:RHS repeat-associated core domain-containing protein [Nitrospirillum amazonense]EGY02684.1 YD repeat-containing protein [Nitrospirillum amazonense Y2]TWB48944.1 RHS repeat-associated protein [Nitrospirillum amazonense]
MAVLTNLIGRIVSHPLVIALAWMAPVVLFAPMARAQGTLNSAPPVYSTVDPQNVDLGTGAFTLTVQEVVIGQPGAGGMSYGRSFIGTGWRDTLMGGINSSGTAYTVSIGGTSETFTASGGVFTNAGGGGSTLTVDSSGQLFTYTMADGTVANFQKTICCNIGLVTPSSTASTLGAANQGRLTSMTFPSGEVRTWNYVFVKFCDVDPSIPCQAQVGRLQSVTNNFGYQIRYQYAANNTTNIQDRASWLSLTGVVGFNMAVDTCDGAAQTCALSSGWPSISYATPGDNAAARTATDPLGRTTRYTYASSRMVAIRRPSSGSDNITIAYDGSGRVSSVSNGAGTWTYSYSDSNGVRTTWITDPMSHTRTVTTNIATGQMLSDTNALGQAVTYRYDSYNRLQQIINPEGDYVLYTFDARGNVLQTTRAPKPNSGLNNIVTGASYDGTCTYPVKCNKPNVTFDAYGYSTNYTYDTTHGGVTVVTAPPPDGGAAARPEVRYSYGQFQARYKNGAGTWISGGAIYRLTGTSSCTSGSGSSCAGAATEIKTSIGYGDTSQPNNLLPVSMTKGAGNGSISATVTASYDSVGNMTNQVGPLAGVSVRYIYDGARQLVGVIGADPDGVGALKSRAMRYTYNADGQVFQVDQGVTNSQSDGDWAGFTTLQRQWMNYDAQGRRIQVNAMSGGGTTQAITQYSYDAANRPLCVAQRMNVAVFGALPGACSLTTAATSGVPGSMGQDRITQYGYDAANRVTSVSSAVGTADQQTTVSTSYTMDGLKASVADANGNLTGYVYDGFNRLSQIQYPLPSNGAATSTTDYEEYGYDYNSRVIRDRRRDGQSIAISHDVLGRVSWRTMPDGAAYGYSYDNLGRVTQVQAAGRTVGFGYDALGNQTTETGPLGTVGRSYDAAGELKQLTWPDGTYATYSYDYAGEMLSVSMNGAWVLTYAYDDYGRRQSISRANGVTTSYGYDSVSRLTSLTQDLAGTGNDVTYTYGYNPAGQIATRDVSNGLYSPVIPSGGEFTYNGLNQATGVQGVVSWDADGRGNWRNSASVTYDADNQLTQVGSVPLAYDPAQRLYQIAASATTRFLYSGSQIIAEYDGSNNVLRRYVPGAHVDEPIVWYEGPTTGVGRWLLADERGSIIAVTDGGGNALAINQYDEYGRSFGATSNMGRFQFTGQAYLPEFSSYYFKARMYSPYMGRFFQPDPSGYSAGMNLYAYAGGDPINRTDPLGLQSSCIDDNSCDTGKEGGVVDAGTITADRTPPIPSGPVSVPIAVPYLVFIDGPMPDRGASGPSSAPKPQSDKDKDKDKTNKDCAYSNGSGCVYVRGEDGKLKFDDDYKKRVCEFFNSMSVSNSQIGALVSPFTATSLPALYTANQYKPFVDFAAKTGTGAFFGATAALAGTASLVTSLLGAVPPPPGC